MGHLVKSNFLNVQIPISKCAIVQIRFLPFHLYRISIRRTNRRVHIFVIGGRRRLMRLRIRRLGSLKRHDTTHFGSNPHEIEQQKVTSLMGRKRCVGLERDLLFHALLFLLPLLLLFLLLLQLLLEGARNDGKKREKVR